MRLLGRTTMEAVRDRLGAAIGQDVARRASAAPAGARFGVIDPFAGSCNGLYWIARSLPGATAIGFEMDETIHALTSRNLSLLDTRLELLKGDYRALLGTRPFPDETHLIVFLAPPWGDALSATEGLDLSRTYPPIAAIVDDFERTYPRNPILYVIEAHERLVPAPLAALRARFDASDFQVYDIEAPHGRRAVLFGAMRGAAAA